MLSGLFSAKFLAVAIALAMMVSTVSIYAANITGTARKLGGTGNVTVSGVTSTSATVSYTLNTTGNISQLNVTWTPGEDGNYNVYGYLTADTGISGCSGSDSGTATVTGSGTSEITTNVNLSGGTIDPRCVGSNSVKVNILKTN